MLALASASAAEGEGALAVTNGGFNNMEGLAPLQQAGWYTGVPAGWTAAPPPEKEGGFFAVRNKGATGFFANLHILSSINPEFHAFKQEVGVLAEMSDVTLTFDTVGMKEEEFWGGAIVARGSGPNRVLTQGDFQAAGAQRPVATNVPAGTWVTITFWAVKGYPGIGNVTIEVTPSP